MLRDPQSDLGKLVNFTTNPDLNCVVETFSESQLRAYIDGLRMKIGKFLQPVWACTGTGKSLLIDWTY